MVGGGGSRHTHSTAAFRAACLPWFFAGSEDSLPWKRSVQLVWQWQLTQPPLGSATAVTATPSPSASPPPSPPPPTNSHSVWQQGPGRSFLSAPAAGRQARLPRSACAAVSLSQRLTVTVAVPFRRKRLDSVTDALQGMTRSFFHGEGSLRWSGDRLMFPAQVVVRVAGKYSWHTALGVVDCYVRSYPLLFLGCWQSLTSALVFRAGASSTPVKRIQVPASGGFIVQWLSRTSTSPSIAFWHLPQSKRLI